MKYDTPIEIDYYTAKEAANALIEASINSAARYMETVCIYDDDKEGFLIAYEKKVKHILAAREAVILAASFAKKIHEKAQADVNAEREEEATSTINA